MRILAIETSCDETAAAIVEKHDAGVSVRASVVSSQIDLHAKYGGVVPNLAAREHTRNIVPVLEETLTQANLSPSDIDLIAVTQGPGLIPALLVGTTAAKTLSYIWQKPLIGIHHIEGHIYANFISNNQSPKSKTQINSNEQISNFKKILKSKIFNQKSDERFPLVALVVSGGHTQLMLMRDHFQYEILGETQDDAVGECFDKVARMLGLPYPGGPVVAKRADSFREHKSSIVIPEKSGIQVPQNPLDPRVKPEDDALVQFPRPMLESENYNFSFSGLKTSVLYFLKKNEEKMKDEKFIDEICYEFQEAAVDVLVEKSKRAIMEFLPKTFVIAGGVSANKELRNRLRTLIEENFPDTTFAMPEFEYSLDNAVMIGAAAAFRYDRMNDEQKSELKNNWQTLEASASLTLQNI